LKDLLYITKLFKKSKLFVKSIYTCHDEIKDKHFELELGWIGKGKKEKIFEYIS
jgi:hypothetical protein